MSYLYSNEIVFRGHPDKVCDQISDMLLDTFLSKDENSRCGIEVMGGKGKVFITGEVSSKYKMDDKKVDTLVKKVLSDVGYGTDIEVINNLGIQSPDIALGVDVGGAGDQGMMFGYACTETSKMLPKAVVILQEFSRKYAELVEKDERFLPDGKAQITGLYDDEGKLINIHSFLVSYQNTEKDRERTDLILQTEIKKICDMYKIDLISNFLFNPTGKFKIGGFEGDAGLTGRKIVVDTYQSFAPVGGGCFSGKDPTKVDRSASYMARKLAKDYLMYNPEEKECIVQLSYAIGKKEPMCLYLKTKNGIKDLSKNRILTERCTPQNIIDSLDLKRVKYYDTAKYGHFGNCDFNWEKIGGKRCNTKLQG